MGDCINQYTQVCLKAPSGREVTCDFGITICGDGCCPPPPSYTFPTAPPTTTRAPTTTKAPAPVTSGPNSPAPQQLTPALVPTTSVDPSNTLEPISTRSVDNSANTFSRIGVVACMLLVIVQIV